MVTFAIAHLSVIVLRYRESDRPSAFRVPLSVKVGRGSVPLPAVLGALFSILAWVSVVVLHEGARVIGGAWMLAGIAMYVIYRRGAGQAAHQALHDPGRGAAGVGARSSTAASSCRCSASRSTTRSSARPGGSRPSTPTRPRAAPCSRRSTCSRSRCRCRSTPACRTSASRRRKQVLARAKEVGEEYEGVEVATAMVRGRTVGQAIVAEARRRGVEAIVLAAEEPTRRARRRHPRRPRALARPLRGGDHPLRDREGALQGDSHGAAGGRGRHPRGRSRPRVAERECSY